MQPSTPPPLGTDGPTSLATEADQVPAVFHTTSQFKKNCQQHSSLPHLAATWPNISGYCEGPWGRPCPPTPP